MSLKRVVLDEVVGCPSMMKGAVIAHAMFKNVFPHCINIVVQTDVDILSADSVVLCDRFPCSTNRRLLLLSL